MSRVMVLGLVGVAFVLGVGAGVLGLLWTTGGLAEPSRDTSDVAPTLALDGPTPTLSTLNGLATQVSEINVKVDALSTQVLESNTRLENQLAATDVPPPTATPQDTGADTTATRFLFRITEDESEARFNIDETLMGSPNLVVGATNRVAGDIIVNTADPVASQVGTIAINARTFKTDESFRDQSIRGQILESSKDEYEFIIFEPQELIGMPAGPVNVGDSISFQVRGDLTIKDVTHSVVFDIDVTLAAADRIEGHATAEIQYADFNLVINAPPTVADVGDTVTMELDFVALQVEE